MNNYSNNNFDNNNMNNQNMHDNIESKKSSSNFVTIILVVLVLVLGGYLVYDKFIDNGSKTDNNNVTNNADNNTNVANKYEMLSKGFDESTDKTKTINNVQLGNEKINITLEKKNPTEGPNGLGGILYINGKKALETDFNLIDVFRLDDIIIVYYLTGDVPGSDHISAYDYKGNKVYEIPTFSGNNSLVIEATQFKLTSAYANNAGLNNYFVKDNNLYVYASYSGENNIYSLPEVCDSNYRLQKNISTSDKVDFLYEIKYLGNYKFSDPIEIESGTLQENLKSCQ